METLEQFVNPFVSPDATPPPAPAREADAHRVKVVAVVPRDAKTGSRGIQFGLESLETGNAINYTIWVPGGYAENINVKYDDLPQGESYIDETTGKTRSRGNQQMQYARNIHNSKNSADLDKLLGYAYAQGKSTSERPSNFEEVCSMLNNLMVDVEFIVERKPQTDNPDYLDVKGHHQIADATSAKYLASLKKRGITARWE